MRKLIAISVLAFFGSISSIFAANLPPHFDAQKWQTLLQQAATQGEEVETPDGYLLHYLTQMTPPDTTRTHQSDYFSVVGAYTGANQFTVLDVSVVSETWTLNSDGNWEIEQWIHEVHPNGDLYRVDHSSMVESPDGSILDMKDFPVGSPSSDTELQKWDAALMNWYANGVQPNGTARN
jgi:hypothetical protein